jgi:hypothetical protein
MVQHTKLHPGLLAYACHLSGVVGFVRLSRRRDISGENRELAQEQPAPDEGREAVAEFVELEDALEALWRVHGGERVPVHIERHGTPPGRVGPAL